MSASVDNIRELREQTSCGVIECKKALEEAKGDFNKAKKGNREAKEGRIESYIHAGSKIGVLVEVNCETDFVAQNQDFFQFTKNLAMQIAATNPKYISKNDVPADVLKSQDDKDQFIKENCLLEQSFIRDQSKTIQDIINGLIASIGENITIKRFIRYKVNEAE